MKWYGLVIVMGGLLGVTACGQTSPDQHASAQIGSETETLDMGDDDPIRGKTVRWTWNDGLDEGPLEGPFTHEHTFHDDGTVTWRVLSGPQAGHSETEEEYAAVRVGDQVYAVSYLAKSGHTLTAVLNFKRGTMVGFASGAEVWFPGRGTFEVVD